MTKNAIVKVSEKVFQTHVIQLARMYDWLVYHTYDSRRSTAGYPDLTLVGNTYPRVIFAELKTEKGRLTQMQKLWGDRISRVPSVEYYVWRPSDFEDIHEVLKPKYVGDH